MVKSVFTSGTMAALVAASIASPLVTANISSNTTTRSSGGAPTSIPRPSPSDIKALQQSLILAASATDRQAILVPNPPDASNLVYQIIDSSSPADGTANLAGVDQFPALLNTNLAFSVGSIPPCGLSVPHSHPRANEFFVVVQGKLTAGLVLEANKGNVNTTLEKYKGMLFPQGLTHYQFNLNCEPVIFAAGFDNRDPGFTVAANNYFSIQPGDAINSVMGGDAEVLDARLIDQLRDKIPNAFAELMGSCAKMCGIAGSNDA